MNPRVTSVRALDDYQLEISFENGERRIFDVKPYLSRGIFVRLRDRSLFQAARAVAGSVEWPGGLDLSYETLYVESHAITNLTGLIESITEDLLRSWNDFEDLRKSGIVDHPIPFQGHVDKARVLTVGVNPSWTEFHSGWPARITAQQLEARLRAYFTNSTVPPHKWFEPWIEVLREIGATYGVGAAHIDLSPRATRAMRDCPPARFRAMVERDVKWFFKLLSLCQHARVILLAGTVTGKEYMNRFVARVAPLHDFALQGRKKGSGPAPVDFHTLVGAGREIPVFFCGMSPSGPHPSLLVQRVREHRAVLRGWLGTEANER